MEQGNTENIRIKLNEFICNIINKHNYFSIEEYNNILYINEQCVINNDIDCPINIKMKQDMQQYIYFFLLEYIKLISSNKEKEIIINDINNYNDSIAHN
jgi:hypothetical protein